MRLTRILRSILLDVLFEFGLVSFQFEIIIIIFEEKSFLVLFGQVLSGENMLRVSLLEVTWGCFVVTVFTFLAMLLDFLHAGYDIRKI
jgi:hypothetical protein